MVVPPNIEQLREARAWWDNSEDATYIPEYVPEYDDAISDALDWLLSLAESGGRLVVEQPCEHGNHDAHPFPDKRIGDFPYCPGGSRTVVWSADKEPLPPCEACGGSGYLGGHGHGCDGSGNEQSCYRAGCPHPCPQCYGPTDKEEE